MKTIFTWVSAYGVSRSSQITIFLRMVVHKITSFSFRHSSLSSFIHSWLMFMFVKFIFYCIAVTVMQLRNFSQTCMANRLPWTWVTTEVTIVVNGEANNMCVVSVMHPCRLLLKFCWIIKGISRSCVLVNLFTSTTVCQENPASIGCFRLF